MCAACQKGYQEIRNLFNHANMMAEITNTISNFSYSVRTFCLDPLPLVHFHTFLGYPLPLSEHTYFLNDPNGENNLPLTRFLPIFPFIQILSSILKNLQKFQLLRSVKRHNRITTESIDDKFFNRLKSQLLKLKTISEIQNEKNVSTV